MYSRLSHDESELRTCFSGYYKGAWPSRHTYLSIDIHGMASFARLLRGPRPISSFTANWGHLSTLPPPWRSHGTTTGTSKSFHQPQEQAPPSASTKPGLPGSAATAQPYSKIPKNKTFLGLNFEIMKDPRKVALYMEEQARKLGNIYRFGGVPGIPEMVVVLDPKDVETAFRVGDVDYPKRFPIWEWKAARKELQKPTGLFLE